MQTHSTNSQDLVSVVISAYNHERYVQDTIQSILDQTYPNIELIITNDGSPDRTHEKIEEMLPRCREKLTRVEYINKSNEGVIKSLNLCLSKATGQYVYFIASDDIADSEAISVLQAFLSKNPGYGLAVGDAAFIDANGKTCYWGHAKKIVYEKSKAKSITQAKHLQRKRPDVDFHSDSFGSYSKLLIGNYVPNGFLIRKDVLDQIGGYSEKAPLEDLHLMLQIAKVSKMKFIDRILFNYRWHDSNTVKQTQRMQEYHKKTIALEIPFAREHGLMDYIQSEKSIRWGRLRIFDLKKGWGWMKIYVLKICIYKHSRHNSKTTYYFLGIPVCTKRTDKISPV